MDDSNTRHRLFNSDARSLSFLSDESIHLVVTSPPYFNIKRYNENEAQLGNSEDYDRFLLQLDSVWKECFRVLVPGGRMVVVVGDVLQSRKQNGRHRSLPLHSHIQVSCFSIGFDNLSPIIWHKISNASHEVERGAPILGKPYEPNAIIKNDIEYVLMLRKPGTCLLSPPFFLKNPPSRSFLFEQEVTVPPPRNKERKVESPKRTLTGGSANCGQTCRGPASRVTLRHFLKKFRRA
jgi:DNA modification methylase